MSRPCQFASAQTKTVAARLGYPADTKLLIVHADDLAIAHSEDVAGFEALDKNCVTSASIIVPAPWLAEVAGYAKAHPDGTLATSTEQVARNAKPAEAEREFRAQVEPSE